ncbi:hypothetical protein LPTSP4_08620 [Leptospira ryugenii]|uniref:Uncharacterized protein n=1 Tax=Leptospira ryugenii TaxID=1917863 RepID=A0A2P2DXJ0_9LEPT|nr:hypothetical protein LPTSP4_08620 [Leptospira ryugenii]
MDVGMAQTRDYAPSGKRDVLRNGKAETAKDENRKDCEVSIVCEKRDKGL